MTAPGRTYAPAHALSRRAMLGGLAASAGLTPLLASCATTAPVSSLQGAVPVELTPLGDFIVRVDLDGAPAVPFKLDTGAGMSALYSDFAHLGTVSDPPETVEVWGLGGTRVCPVARIGRFAIGGRAYANLPVSVLDQSRPGTGAVGILGMDILRDWVLEARSETGERGLYPASELNWRRFHAWDRAELTEDPFGAHGFGLKFGWVTVMGRRVAALVDTGSHLSVINWEAARLVPELDRYWERSYRAWRYYGAVGDFRVTGTSELFDVSMGSVRWDRVEVIITDLDSLSLLGSDGHPLIIAGANMLAERDFVFHPAGNELRVRGPRRVSPGVVMR